LIVPPRHHNGPEQSIETTSEVVVTLLAGRLSHAFHDSVATPRAVLCKCLLQCLRTCQWSTIYLLWLVYWKSMKY